VDFFRGTTRIASDPNAPYSTVLSNVATGTYVFTALAIDSGGSIAVSNPVVVRVDNPPTVALTSPAINTVFAPGTDIKVTASASDSDEVVRKVEFFANGHLIGTQALTPYQITWTNVPPGRYTLTARATDLVGMATTSTPVEIDVGSAPAIVITNPTDGATFVAPATIPVTALAGDSDGTVTRVEFFDGGVLVGTATASSGNSSYSATLSDLAVGQHTFTARAVDDQGFATVSRPVAVTINAATAQMYYIHTDHLNTPRMIVDQAGIPRWISDNAEPFGSTPPNNDPDADGITFEFNIRFPGQLFDGETAVSQNHFRDYDSGIGRYVESDPIGLAGGVNTYAYVRGNPIASFDLHGLQDYMCIAAGISSWCPKPTPTEVPPAPPRPLPCDCEDAKRTCIVLVNWYPVATTAAGGVGGAGLGRAGSVIGPTLGAGAGMSQGGLYDGCRVGYEKCKKRCDCES
jgi:RHS repeat-associated protein